MKRILTTIASIWMISGIGMSAEKYIVGQDASGATDAVDATDDMRPVGSFGLSNGDAPTTNPLAGNIALYSDANGNPHVLESDATDVQLMRPDEDTSMTASLEVPSLHVTGAGNGMMVYGKAEVQTRYKQVVTVSQNAADNPDRATIQGAIDLVNWYGDASDAARYCIEVQPGTYAEQSLEIPDNCDLRGVSRDGCIISMTSTNYDSADARTSALVAAPGNSLVADLTINNTRTSYPSAALNLGWGWTAGTTSGKSPRAFNCVLRGAREDILYTSGASTIIVSSCRIISTGGGDVWSSYSVAVSGLAVHRIENSYIGAEGAGSPATAVWMNSTGRCEINNCRIRSDASSASRGAFRFEDTTGTNGALLVSNSRIEGQAGALGNVLEAQTTGTGWNVYIHNTAYALTNTVAGVTVPAEDMGDGDKSMGGNLTALANVLFNSATGHIFATKTGDAHPWLNVDNELRMIRFGDGTALAGNSIGYLGDSLRAYNEWKFVSDVQFGLEGDGRGANVNFIGEFGLSSQVAFKVDGITPGDGSVVLTWGPANDTNLYRSAANVLKTDDAFVASGLSTTSTLWRYLDAPSLAVPAGLGTYGGGALSALMWYDGNGEYAKTLGDAVLIYFPIPYEAGTIVSQVSARWQGVGASDGIIFTLQKRQDGTVSAGWSTVGAAQTVTGTSETVSVYNVADETLDSGYSYRLAVEAQVVTTGSRLWQVGIETTGRSY